MPLGVEVMLSGKAMGVVTTTSVGAARAGTVNTARARAVAKTFMGLPVVCSRLSAAFVTILAWPYIFWDRRLKGRAILRQCGKTMWKERDLMNRIEGFWSLFKRSIAGSFHKVGKKYLPLYVAEAQFRYNNC